MASCYAVDCLSQRLSACNPAHPPAHLPLPVCSWRRFGGGTRQPGGGGSARSRACWQRCKSCRRVCCTARLAGCPAGCCLCLLPLQVSCQGGGGASQGHLPTACVPPCLLLACRRRSRWPGGRWGRRSRRRRSWRGSASWLQLLPLQGSSRLPRPALPGGRSEGHCGVLQNRPGLCRLPRIALGQLPGTTQHPTLHLPTVTASAASLVHAGGSLSQKQQRKHTSG